MLANNLCYLYRDGFLTLRPLLVNSGGGDAAGGSASTPLRTVTTRGRFVGYFAALCEAFGLPLFSVSRDFSAVAASRCSYLSARSAASASACAFFASRRSSAARCRATFASSCCCLFYAVAAAFASLSRDFWSCSCSASPSSAALRARALWSFLGLMKTAPPCHPSPS
jgi:hypothetical protein